MVLKQWVSNPNQSSKGWTLECWSPHRESQARTMLVFYSVTTKHQNGQLKAIEIYSDVVLEARSSRSMCGQCGFLLEALWKNPFQVSHLASGGSWHSWYSLVYSCITAILVSMVLFPMFLSVSMGQEDPLEKKMATHSSTLAWRISWTEYPSRL